MTKTQEQTLEILKALVEKQKNAIGKKDAEISKLTDYLLNEDQDDKISKLSERIDCLEDQILDEGVKEEIQCGIGVIHYAVPNNLQLRLIMESLESAIKTQGPLFVLEALTIIS